MLFTGLCIKFNLLMPKNQRILRVDGLVEEALPGLLFRVKISVSDNQDKIILAHLAGRLKLHRIRVIPGDRVTLEMTNMNDERARIVRRL